MLGPIGLTLHSSCSLGLAPISISTVIQLHYDGTITEGSTYSDTELSVCNCYTITFQLENNHQISNTLPYIMDQLIATLPQIKYRAPPELAILKSQCVDVSLSSNNNSG